MREAVLRIIPRSLARIAALPAPFSITEAGPDLVLIELTADDFLYRMPALIIGTLLEIGLGRRSPDCIKAIFEGTEKAGAPCGTKGLLLKSVHY